MSRDEQPSIIAQRYLDDGFFSSIAWHMEHQGQTLSSGALGQADALTGQALPADPIYRIYSMTKPIISVLALMLIEQGKLRLIDPLMAFDDRFAQLMVLEANGTLGPPRRPVNVDDLITHRAGFTYEFILGCHIAQFYREADIVADGQRSLDDMMGALAEIPLAFQPGTQFRYSVATDVLAHVIERATGQPLDTLLQTHLFEPLGMRDTAFAVPADQQHRLLPMFGAGDLTAVPNLAPALQELKYLDVDEMYPVDNLPNFRRGGIGLFSTLADYTAFARMLLTGKTPAGETLLSRPMVTMMRTNRIPPEQLPLKIGPQALLGYGWGLGVRVMIDRGAASSLTGDGELGWAGAAGTYFWVDPAESLVGVIMTQYLGAMMPMSDDMRVAGYQMLT